MTNIVWMIELSSLSSTQQTGWGQRSEDSNTWRVRGQPGALTTFGIWPTSQKLSSKKSWHRVHHILTCFDQMLPVSAKWTLYKHLSFQNFGSFSSFECLHYITGTITKWHPALVCQWASGTFMSWEVGLRHRQSRLADVKSFWLGEIWQCDNNTSGTVDASTNKNDPCVYERLQGFSL